jgi:hypothetical protein
MRGARLALRAVSFSFLLATVALLVAALVRAQAPCGTDDPVLCEYTELASLDVARGYAVFALITALLGAGAALGLRRLRPPS